MVADTGGGEGAVDVIKGQKTSMHAI